VLKKFANARAKGTRRRDNKKNRQAVEVEEMGHGVEKVWFISTSSVEEE